MYPEKQTNKQNHFFQRQPRNTSVIRVRYHKFSFNNESRDLVLFPQLSAAQLYSHFLENSSVPYIHSKVHTDSFVTLTNCKCHWMPLWKVEQLLRESQPCRKILTGMLQVKVSKPRDVPALMRQDVFCKDNNLYLVAHLDL